MTQLLQANRVEIGSELSKVMTILLDRFRAQPSFFTEVVEESRCYIEKRMRRLVWTSPSSKVCYHKRQHLLDEVADIIGNFVPSQSCVLRAGVIRQPSIDKTFNVSG